MNAPASFAQAPALSWITNPETFVPSSDVQPLLLFFYGSDRTSRRMVTWTFTNLRVREALEGVTPVRIEAWRLPRLAEQYEVTSVPAVVLITPQEEILGRHQGLLEAEEFVTWVEASLARVRPERPPVLQEQAPSPETQMEEFLYYDFTEEPITPTIATPTTHESAPQIEIRFRPIARWRPGVEIPVQVFVPTPADAVELNYRRPGEESFQIVRMAPNTPTLYYGVIPAGAVTHAGLEYYISVRAEGRQAMHPPEGPGAPHRIAVQ